MKLAAGAIVIGAGIGIGVLAGVGFAEYDNTEQNNKSTKAAAEFIVNQSQSLADLEACKSNEIQLLPNKAGAISCKESVVVLKVNNEAPEAGRIMVDWKATNDAVKDKVSDVIRQSDGVKRFGNDTGFGLLGGITLLTSIFMVDMVKDELRRRPHR